MTVNPRLGSLRTSFRVFDQKINLKNVALHFAGRPAHDDADGSGHLVLHPLRPICRRMSGSESIHDVNRDEKTAIGTLLILIGAVWLFFVIIWMPPLCFLVALVGPKIGLPDGFYGQWLLWLESALATCVAGSGIYFLICRRSISN